MLTVHIISDSIGNTAKDVVDAALVQFSYENKKYKVLKNSNVCTKEKIDCIISNVNEGDVHTIPFYIRDLSIHIFWHPLGLLEPISSRYQGTNALEKCKCPTL